MKLFNKDGQGSEEIVRAVGLISNGVTFDKWEPLLPFGIREVAAIVGRDVIDAIAAIYADGAPDDAHATLIALTQQAVAFFTWLKIIPTLDAQHDETGRSRRLGENEKGLTAIQEFKDEENILHLGYDAVDALVEELDRGAYDFWLNSAKYRLRGGLIIRNKDEFDSYYNIGSHRLFITLLPIIREVQGSVVAPVLGRWLNLILAEPANETTLLLKDTAARAVALLTMQKAVERLPVEIIPEGVVQVQQSQPVKSRLKAEQSARTAVAASLGADAKKYINNLQQLVAQLEAADAPIDQNVPGPIVHSKGLSF